MINLKSTMFSVLLFILISPLSHAGYEEGLKAFQDKDYITAKKELVPLERQRDARAANLLGDMYYEGLGVQENESIARDYYLQAANQGHMDAQYSLGWLHENSKNEFFKSDSIALMWYRKAADQGHKNAQVKVGAIYEFGRGVPVSTTQAITWYRKAADQGFPPGQNNLGVMYQYGKGVIKDPKEALIWYGKAAVQHNPTAMFNLGSLYEEGEGVDRDILLAIHWYAQAINNGEKQFAFKHLQGLFDKAEKAEIRSNKTPFFNKRKDAKFSFILDKGNVVALFGEPIDGRVFALFTNTDDQYGWVNTQAIETQTQKENRIAFAFRPTIKVGIETNCGPALEIRGELVKVYSPVKDYGNEHWIRRDQLYPSGSGCSFQNGRYIGR